MGLLTVVAVFALPAVGRAQLSKDRGQSPDPTGVSLDTGPFLPESWKLIGTRAALGAAGGGLLYLLPSRAASATKRRVEAEMTERALTLQEEDRRRIARELHDGAGQALTAARLHLAALKATSNEAEKVDAILGHLDEAMEEIRRSTAALAPPALAEYGLSGALERHCRSFGAASKLQVNCDLPHRLAELPAHIETACYRIVQEALSNAARHSGARHAWVKVEVASRDLRLEVSDDGAGPAGGGGDGDGDGDGFGLASIRERANLLGGEVELGDRPKAGTWLRVRLPLDGGRA